MVHEFHIVNVWYNNSNRNVLFRTLLPVNVSPIEARNPTLSPCGVVGMGLVKTDHKNNET